MHSYARSLMTFGALALLGTATVLQAQTTDSITTVPFAFTVGTETLPRDTYRVSRLGGHTDVFMISGQRHSAIVLSQPDGRAADSSPRLVFNRYGDQYFLREVRLPGNTGFTLPTSRQERDAAERIAANVKPEIVVVHAQQE